jgi:Mg/Co/Ni transporter MgtE
VPVRCHGTQIATLQIRALATGGVSTIVTAKSVIKHHLLL